MMHDASSTEQELAAGWPLSRVEACLVRAEKIQLIALLRLRYTERFFQPIRSLRGARGHSKGFGFAIMSLCSLLVENLQCYRLGLPTTHNGEYPLLARLAPPPEYDIPRAERRNGRQVFLEFFAFAPNQQLFPGVNGETYYSFIRNGLLHQAQTKDGWRIKIRQAHLWNDQSKVVDRDKFADALSRAFSFYLAELTNARWDDDLWRKARRKIWWIIKLSE